MAEVTLERVTKRYGDVIAVADLSLEVRDKEFLVLVGPSGCGKSTTLRLIAGLEAPTEGHIYIDGRCVDDVLPKDRDVAMVFQNYALYPHMDVYQNIAFPLKLRKVPRAEIDRRVREVAALLGLTELLGRKPRELSGGQQQRVALGRAIVRKPAVFLMDEPLSNIDAQRRMHMRAELSRLQRRLETTTLYVTHDQTEAMTMGDRIAVMRDGVLQQVGTPMEVYQYPVNRFVAGFIGSPPMNFLKAVLRRGNYRQRDERFDDWSLEVGGLSLPLPRGFAARRRGLPRYEGREVVLGVRPEHMKEQGAGEGLPPLWRIEGWAEIVEPTGSETYVHFRFAGDVLIARVPAASAAKRGRSFSVFVDMNCAHLFDPQTERAIL